MLDCLCPLEELCVLKKQFLLAKLHGFRSIQHSFFNVWLLSAEIVLVCPCPRVHYEGSALLVENGFRKNEM